MYILVVPADDPAPAGGGSNSTPAPQPHQQPKTRQLAASAPSPNRAENPENAHNPHHTEPAHFENPAGGASTTQWGLFYLEEPTGEQVRTQQYTPTVLRAHRVSAAHLPAYVREVEARADRQEEPRVRWVWADTRVVASLLLDAGVRAHLCHDMRLVQRILTTAATHPAGGVHYTPALNLSTEHNALPGAVPAARQIEGQQALFESLDLDALPQPIETNREQGYAPHQDPTSEPANNPLPDTVHTPLIAATLAEFAAQLHAVARAPHPDRLTLLSHAESAGALVAAEIGHEGIPFDVAAHNANLTKLLGPRPTEGEHPAKMVELAEHIRQALFAPQLNPDSPQELLRALQRAGVQVESTRSYRLLAWADEVAALRAERHALIDPVLRYKKLYRIWTANGWNWADAWVRDGRFRPHLEVGGAATGRWGASGGGALQLPAQIRSAVIAPDKQVFTVSDGSQIEPRILAALSRDEALAAAGRGTLATGSVDLYEGIARLSRERGLGLTERSQAKVGLLAIMYGGRSGQVGALLPHIAQLFPRAMEFTERAARIGEAGGQVTTFLGRTSPAPSEQWRRTVADCATGAAEARALSVSRSWGRMTRNFVVQGTAAEWALCWMGRVRSRLLSERVFGMPMRTRIVYFLHDELVLCGPKFEVQRVEVIVRQCAQQAAHLLFGEVPVDFPVSVTVTKNYAEAK